MRETQPKGILIILRNERIAMENLKFELAIRSIYKENKYRCEALQIYRLFTNKGGIVNLQKV